jgi:predicted DCC family thiol-disulfide oxidoreductase YuxK
LLFDGDCGFCTNVAGFAARVSPRTTVIAWQHADLPTLGVTAEQADAALQYVDGTRTSAGAEAVARFLVATGGVVALLGRVLLLPGIRVVARPAYRWVAAHRHQLPGGTPVCAIDAKKTPTSTA